MKIGDVYNPADFLTGAFVPNWLLRRSEVSPGAKLCYGILCWKMENEGKAPEDFPAMAAELGMRESDVRGGFGELIQHNLCRRTWGDLTLPWHPWMEEPDSV